LAAVFHLPHFDLELLFASSPQASIEDELEEGVPQKLNPLINGLWRYFVGTPGTVQAVYRSVCSV
jgi:hypothetical protein